MFLSQYFLRIHATGKEQDVHQESLVSPLKLGQPIAVNFDTFHKAFLYLLFLLSALRRLLINLIL